MLIDGKEWRLVPAEPTEEMRLAFWLEWKTAHSQGDGQLSPSYRAMLDAAPTPPAETAAAQEAVGEVYTMLALVPDAEPKCHVTLYRPLPAGTKVYAAPVAAQPQGDDARDAARYRWLRAQKIPDGLWVARGNLGCGLSLWNEDHLDAAVDAAIAAKGE